MQASTVAIVICCFMLWYLLARRTRSRAIRRLGIGHKTYFLIPFAFAVLLMVCVLSLALSLMGQSFAQSDSLLGVVAILALSVVLAFSLERHVAPVTDMAARRILVVGAHPDDLELACGGTVASLVDRGHIVRTIIMSDGKEGGHADTRMIEARSGSEFLGVSEVEVHQFTDTRLSDHSCELISVVENAVNQFRPDIILTHSGHDQHQDHQAVHEAVLRGARRAPSILCFESPSATRQFNPSIFIDISGYINVKVEAVAVHHDQAKKPYMTATIVRSIAAFRGIQARCEFAEAFEPVRYQYAVKELT